MEPDGEQSRLETSEIHSWLADLERASVTSNDVCPSKCVAGLRRIENGPFFSARLLPPCQTVPVGISRRTGHRLTENHPRAADQRNRFLRKRRGMHGLPAASDAPTIEPGIQILSAAKDLADRSSIRDPSLRSG